MKKNANALALHIAQILEEHSAKEINEAVSILRGCGTTSELLTYLATAAMPAPSADRRKGSEASSRSKPLDQVTSKAVRDLEKVDPNKYLILLEFDTLLRQGRVLETNDAVRRFGERVSKDFKSRTSRKDNIGNLMSALARLEEDELNQVLNQAIESASERKSDGYQRLAQFLMRTK
ncbi:hypothetical protein [uncultured Paracoccus sp.]|uniref:hypothetical protein n=1 Tax=uncultured Paracoccus sp. TaxID=189685 RepID=UPI002637C923|nr:hypothetical protein [uncultured Paracoccus sp.]